MYQLTHGFTLIELMIVVAIIGIMASIAIPTYQDYIIRAQITEAMNLTEGVKKSITEYYVTKNQFPANNQVAAVPKPEYLIGNFVKRVEVKDGAIHITLGHRVNAYVADKILTLRPAIVTANPTSPISWLCGYSQPVDGMSAVGDNKTTVPEPYLSPACRAF